jgi:hypothetical protein
MNPLTRRPMSRRTALRGIGAALALPLLDAMAPRTVYGAASAAPSLLEPPLRSAFLFMPNGVRPDHWTPAGDGEAWELTPMLRPLAKVKDDILLLENLWNEKTVGRNGHWPKVPAFLSGGYVVRTSGRDMDTGGTSVDQVMAQHLGERTPLPSFELGVDEAYTGVDNIGGGFTRIYGSHIAWRDPHTPVPKEIIPRLAFDRLFRTGPAAPTVSGFTTRQPTVVKSLARDDTSVLDLVMEDAKNLQNRVGAGDRAKIDEYLESVRSVERRIERALKPQVRWINAGRFDVLRPGPGIPESHEEHVRLMLDVLVLAFWTDSTRVATFMFGNAQTGRNFSFIDGVRGSFHGLSHHRNEPKTLAQYEKIGTWHVVQLGYLLERMKHLDEAGTPLLDNCQVLFGSTIRDGNSHDEHNLPLVLAGRGKGTIKPGRRVRYERDTPLCNLYVALLNRAGIETKQFGDSTGELNRLG